MVRSKKSLTLLDCKLEMYFTYICMAFHSNLETDYDPDYLDSKLKMQYLLYGKSQRENNYIFVKVMNQRFFLLFDCQAKKSSFSLGSLL